MHKAVRSLMVSLTVAASVVASAGVAAAATWSSSDKWATWANGGYTVRNDGWGAGAGGQAIWATSYGNWGVWANHPNTGGVKSYPHAAKNVNKRLSALGTATSSFSVT